LHLYQQYIANNESTKRVVAIDCKISLIREYRKLINLNPA